MYLSYDVEINTSAKEFSPIKSKILAYFYIWLDGMSDNAICSKLR